MSKQLKMYLKDDFKKRLGNERSVIVLKLDKFTVERANELRTKLRGEGARMTVVRNRVAQLALGEMKGAGELLAGMNAVAYGGTDGAASVSRVVSEWTKKNKEGGISVIGGFVDGRKLSASEVEILATLPTRPQLLAMIAATVTAPMQQIASQVSELLAGVARAVDAVRESKEKAG